MPRAANNTKDYQDSMVSLGNREQNASEASTARANARQDATQLNYNKSMGIG